MEIELWASGNYECNKLRFTYYTHFYIWIYTFYYYLIFVNTESSMFICSLFTEIYSTMLSVTACELSYNNIPLLPTPNAPPLTTFQNYHGLNI